MRKCSCGFMVGSPDFVFCPKCGAKLPEEKISEQLAPDTLAVTIAGALANPEIRNQVALFLSGALRRLVQKLEL